MPKLTCECGAVYELTDDSAQEMAGKQFKCRRCGKARRIPSGKPGRSTPATSVAEIPALASDVDDLLSKSMPIASDDPFGEIEAADMQHPRTEKRVFTAPLAASIQREMEEGASSQRKKRDLKIKANRDRGWSSRILDVWASLVVVACYLSGFAAIAVWIALESKSAFHEIFSAICFLIAVVGFAGGCSVQLLLSLYQVVERREVRELNRDLD